MNSGQVAPAQTIVVAFLVGVVVGEISLIFRDFSSDIFRVQIFSARDLVDITVKWSTVQIVVIAQAVI